MPVSSLERIGKLTVICRGSKYRREFKWWVDCACGETFQALQANLVGRKTLSCGCQTRAKARVTNFKHGESNSQRTPEYISWMNMIQRCTNPRRRDYRDYGGRGIRVCLRWREYRNFLHDMGRKPRGTSLDRKDVNKGYSPSNCRWATNLEQRHNRRW